MKKISGLNVKFCTLHPNTPGQVSIEKLMRGEKDSKDLAELIKINRLSKT